MGNSTVTTVLVDGMTCPACERRIESALAALDGVARARANLKAGKVLVEHEEARPGRRDLELAVIGAGYAVRTGADPSTGIAFGIGLLLAAAYAVASALGAFRNLPGVDSSLGYGALFAVGFLTSIHCVAMCGGIALSQSVGSRSSSARGGASRDPRAPAGAGRFRAFAPGLLYNAGRVASYTLIGGLVGAFGAVFGLSPLAKGLIAAFAAAFMILFGLTMLGIVRGFPRLASALPARLRAAAAKARGLARNRGPLAVGLLNGLMPCGPLQAMQLYALGTGNALAGAASMLAFSLGTVPIMSVFAATAALLPRRFVPLMAKSSAVLVLVLGIVTAGRAAALAGVSLPGLQSGVAETASGRSGGTSGEIPGVWIDGNRGEAGNTATLSGGVQAVVTEFTGGLYAPFTVQAGTAVRWTIRIRAEDLNGCNRVLVVPAYGIRKTLVAGDNLIEFTPRKSGTIAYSCWMGMIKSKITVVDDLGVPGPGPSPKG